MEKIRNSINRKQQTKTILALSLLTTLGKKMRWARSTDQAPTMGSWGHGFGSHPMQCGPWSQATHAHVPWTPSSMNLVVVDLAVMLRVKKVRAKACNTYIVPQATTAAALLCDRQRGPYSL